MAILTCTCVHEFQNKTYGKNKRVHNYAPKATGDSNGYRCTVCGEVHTKGTQFVIEDVEE